ncbi:uncharacterized protein DUF937 [Gillisia mitskevichiae]|uniref:Uncharacterized protein DUF937 n=1 Tax=Gillisia mitskevichiae TaxID=270921 RepID=A0A495PRI0_9FLAO|nr:DUF937 domain-containing protein [Gillisia mitskevichiae]RKS53254.1 uncharacterized protein DUF937 [Gillisia mitskevichiae]
MASILDLLNTSMGEDFIAKASDSTSENKDNISAALGMALPILLGAMQKNIKTDSGAESLNNALSSNKHGDALLSNLKSVNATDMSSEGEKILGHLLGGKQDMVTKTIGSTLNMKESSVSSIIKMAAPLLMSILASQKSKENVSSSGLGGLLESVMGSSGAHDASLIETLLDKDGDGSVIDDVAGMIFGGNKKGGGGLLGGMLGGK